MDVTTQPHLSAHSENLGADGECELDGCLLHAGPAKRWYEDLLPVEDLPSGGDGSPYFPGGIGCDWEGCNTLWATSQSAERHGEWHQAQEDHAVDHGVSYRGY